MFIIKLTERDIPQREFLFVNIENIECFESNTKDGSFLRFVSGETREVKESPEWIFEIIEHGDVMRKNAEKIKARDRN